MTNYPSWMTDFGNVIQSGVKAITNNNYLEYAVTSGFGDVPIAAYGMVIIVLSTLAYATAADSKNMSDLSNVTYNAVKMIPGLASTDSAEIKKQFDKDREEERKQIEKEENEYKSATEAEKKEKEEALENQKEEEEKEKEEVEEEKENEKKEEENDSREEEEEEERQRKKSGGRKTKHRKSVNKRNTRRQK